MHMQTAIKKTCVLTLETTKLNNKTSDFKSLINFQKQ